MTDTIALDKDPVIQGEVAELEANTAVALTLEVGDEASNQIATNIAVEIAGKLKGLEAERKKLTAPILASKKVVDDWFKRVMDPAEEILNNIKASMTNYYKKTQAEARKEEARLQVLADKRRERAEAAGREVLPEIITPTIASIAKTSQGDAGTVTMRSDWVAALENDALVPMEFGGTILRPVDMGAVRKLVKAGIRNIPGIRIVEDFTPSVRS